MSEGENEESMNGELSRTSRCAPRVRTLSARAGLALRCVCGAETGRCQPGRSGSSRAARHRDKPPPPGELRRRGSPPPAAADWPPDERERVI